MGSTILRDYLRRSVPNFIADKTDIKNSQTPFAMISSSNSFIIHEIIHDEEKIKNEDIPIIDISINSIILYNTELKNVKYASGFKNNHWAPDNVNSASESFIQKAFGQEVGDEIQTIYQNSKEILNFKRQDFKKEIDQDKCTIENKVFKYNLKVSQNINSPSFAQFDRELIIYDYSEITFEFDNIFFVMLNHIIIDCDLTGNIFDDLVLKFENLAEDINGKFIDDDRKKTLNFTTVDGLEIILYFEQKKMRIFTKRKYRIKDFLDRTETFINIISKNKINFTKK